MLLRVLLFIITANLLLHWPSYRELQDTRMLWHTRILSITVVCHIYSAINSLKQVISISTTSTWSNLLRNTRNFWKYLACKGCVYRVEVCLRKCVFPRKVVSHWDARTLFIPCSLSYMLTWFVLQSGYKHYTYNFSLYQGMHDNTDNVVKCSNNEHYKQETWRAFRFIHYFERCRMKDL